MLELPSWVRKRNGRIVPFDADKIGQIVFAAAESVGIGDVLLARDLTSGILHFLAEEAADQTVATEQIAEVVVKVIRELGQPQLADAILSHRQDVDTISEAATDTIGTVSFALSRSPAEVRSQCTSAYTLQACFARDVARAHEEGLLSLCELEEPLDLSGVLLSRAFDERSFLGQLGEVLEPAGRAVVMDLSSRSLAELNRSPDWDRIGELFLGQLDLVLRLTGRRAIINCNVRSVWSKAGQPERDNFMDDQRAHDAEREALQLDDALAQTFSGTFAESDRALLDWHLSADDFADGESDRLRSIAAAALRGVPIRFVFDRPRAPVSLGEGITRKLGTVLLTVELCLPALARVVRDDNVDAFFDKLNPLSRLALSAGLQKRAFLRERLPADSAARRGFLLERARLLVVPNGLDPAVRALTGRHVCESEKAIELACRIVQKMQEQLVREGKASGLEACVDSPLGSMRSAGLSCWDDQAPPQAQLQAIGKLHAVSQSGTGLVLLPRDKMTSADQLVDWLQKTWRQGDVARLCFVRPDNEPRQLTLEQP